MGSWRGILNGDPLPWLLEPDPVQPGVRYFALRELLDRGKEDDEVREAQALVMSSGLVPVHLAKAFLRETLGSTRVATAA